MMRSAFSAIAIPARGIRLFLAAAALAAAATLPFLPVPAWAWTALRLFLQL